MNNDMKLYKKKFKENINILINQNKLEEAKKLLNEYENIVKDDIEVYSIKGVIAIMEGKTEEAEKILQYALTFDKNNSDILFNLGYIYETKSQYKEAYKCYLEAKQSSKDREFISNVNSVIFNLGKNFKCNNYGKISIVILTYNKLEYTKLCIDSIRKYTTKESYEIIVVDNYSTDGTRKWLKQQNDIKVILNDENLGFPGACNVGIKVAQKNNDILLLNNDTIVTPRWLDNLNKCLYSDKSIGAVGAVTNNCANYQSIQVDYKSIDEMIAFSEKYNISDPSKWEQKVRLIGFCMLIKRSVIDKIGLLDERFSPGNFEDDDLGYRIQSEGYKLMLCNDTFIHHFGGTSFKENQEKFINLLNENSKKFMNKWGFDSEEKSYVNFNIIQKLDMNKSNFNVLHIGCGTGSLLYKIKYIFKDANLYGIDNNKITSKILNNFVNVKTANIDDKLDYSKDFFDYIIVTDSIEYSKDPKTALQKLLKFIKQTGKIIVTIENSNFYEKFIKILMGSQDSKNKNLYNYNEIKKMFSSQSFLEPIIQSETVNISSNNEMVLDYICKLTGENMKKQYITKEYLITFGKKVSYEKEVVYILRRIENSISVEENLKLLGSYLDNINCEELNEIVMKSTIKKEKVFNSVAVYLYNNHKYMESLKVLNLSYKYNPNNKDTVYNISYIIYKLGEKQTALSYLNSFLGNDKEILELKKEILGDKNE